MKEEIRHLSDAEIDAVAGGLQYNDNYQNYVMSAPPAQPQVTQRYDMSSPY